jgi:hypothetical protein
MAGGPCIVTPDGAKQIADWIVAGATLAALLVAAWQLRANSRLAGQNFARQMWSDYLRQGLENPDLGETRIALKQLRIRTAKALVSGDTVGSQRYLWFLTVALDACENALRYLSVRDWMPTIEEQVRFHRPALLEMWHYERRLYSNALDQIVTRILTEPETAQS